MLDQVLSFNAEAKKGIKEIVEFNLSLITRNGSGFDSYVVLNNLPQWRSVVNLIKNEAGIASLIIYNGYVDANEKLSSIYSFSMPTIAY